MSSGDTVEDFLAREQEQLAGIEDELGVPEVREEVNGFNGVENTGVNENGQDGDVTETTPTGTPMTLSALPPQQQAAMRQAATPTPPLQREEPAKIRIWREQQKDRLEKKDSQEEKEKEKWREQGKRELEDWYKNYREQMEKGIKNNRVVEEEFIQQRDADQPGQEWERITRLCEFNPKSAKNTKDVSRFRSMLLQLKSQPVDRK